MRYLIVLQLYLITFMAGAQVMNDVFVNDLQAENKQLSHKFRMASYLLTNSPIRSRVMSGRNLKAKKMFSSVEENFELVSKKINEKKWLEANAIIDSVLRDLTSISQMLNKKNINRSQYSENIKRVTSFVFPEWSDLSDDEKKYLKVKENEINRLMEQADALGIKFEYARANKVLDKVYSLKTHLIKVLKHENTIVYDHMFDTPEEEFKYMLKRSDHYLYLVDGVFKNNSFNPQTIKLIDTYVQQGKTGIIKARAMENNKRHEEAISALDKSIKNLSDALKIMGVRP